MDNSATADAPKKKAFYKKPLGCLVTLVVAGLLFTVLLSVIGIWFAGSDFPIKAAGKFVNDKSGGNLVVAENDSNFFAGRLHWKGFEITNPTRFVDKRFIKLNEIKGVVQISSLASDTIVVPEVTVDIGGIAIVGTDDWKNDNNVFDFKKAFAGEPAKEGEKPVEPKPGEKKPDEPAQEGPKKHFRIGKLILRLDRISVLSHATTKGEQPRVIVDDSAHLNWEFTDITDENIEKKVYAVVQKDVLNLGKFAVIAGLNLVSAEAQKYAEDLTKGATEAVNKVSGQVVKGVDDAAKSLTDGLGGLLGGSKKKEENK